MPCRSCHISEQHIEKNYICEEFNRRMYHSSQMDDSRWESDIGSSSLAEVGGLKEPSFEPIISPSNVVTPLQSSSWMGFHKHEHQVEIPSLCFQLPNTMDSPLLFSQSFGDNFSTITEQDPPTSLFKVSVVESFLSGSEDRSFSEKYSELAPYSEQYSNFPGDNMPLSEQYPQENKSLANVAAADESPLEISFQKKQPGKQSSGRPWLVGCATSSNSVSRISPTCKRRIRWTKDLHESFMMIVNRLGGPEKAKPKTILKMMDSDGLTLYHVKSHLQKCRSTMYMQKWQERFADRHSADVVPELQFNIHKQIEETWELQLEVRRSLAEQQELQQTLKLLIEDLGKQLKIMLDHQKQISNDSKLEVFVPK